MTTTAKITAKGTSNTGITEDLAKRCHDQLGRKVLAVVELVAETRSENRKGDEQVSLSILTVEPAPDGMTENHLRELARSFYYERQLAEGQAPTLEFGDNPEPDLASVLAAGAKHQPHPYLASMLSTDDNAVCDVCGLLEGAAVHADRSKLADPFASATVADSDTKDEDDDQHDDQDDSDDQDEETYDDDHDPSYGDTDPEAD